MSLFDLFFSSGPKIYAARIEKIPASIFNRELRLTVNGQKNIYSEVKLKALLVSLAQGGVSLGQLEEKLKKMGLTNDQFEKRKWLMEILKDGCFDKKPEKKAEIKEEDIWE